jgi:hypothetical protein
MEETMIDIIKKLRRPVSAEDDLFYGQFPGEEIRTYDAVRFEGADEIERLRAALEKIADTDPDGGTQWFHDVANAALEIEAPKDTQND